MSARPGSAEHGAAVAAACAQRLRRSADVRAAFASRAAASTSLLVVHARRRDDDGPARATVVAGRKVGKAVARNRAKRRLRAAFGHAGAPAGVDLVIVARQPAAAAPFTSLSVDLQRAVTKAVRRA